MYVAPEVKVLLALANVAATSEPVESTTENEDPGMNFIGECL